MTPATSFEGIAECIYCGRSDARLTDEHIVPFALGGNFVLRQASCPKCNVVTSRIERAILKGYFGSWREALNFPTRRPNHRSDKIEVRVSDKDGNETVSSLPWERYPAMIALLPLSEPTHLIGEPFTGSIQVGRPWIGNPGKNKLVEGQTTREIKIDDFVRFLAKLAHAMTVARLGNQAAAYTQVLKPIVLGQNEMQFHYVGGSLTEHLSLKAEPETRFPVTFGFVQNVRDGVETMSVRLHLFSDMGSPVYYVVFGFREAVDGLPLSLVWSNGHS